MHESIEITVNDRRLTIPAGSTIAAALLSAGIKTFRRSVSGQGRGPVCGMGTCFECRVTVNGRLHVLSCQTLCDEGMEIRTDG